MLPDPALTLDLLVKLKPPAKVAFAPAPGVQQAVIGQAQAGMPPGGPPPGGDPAAAGAMPPDAAAGGPPPGGDPNAPPPDPNVPAGPSPVEAKLDQLIQLMQANAQGGGVGPNGKPNTASIKFEPAHFQQMQHSISNINAVLTQMADQLGLQVPASELLNQPAPGAPAPTGPAGQPGQPAPAGGAPAPAAGPGGPQPFAQQLPSLPAMPPAAAKAAGASWGDVIARTPFAPRATGELGAGFIGGVAAPEVSRVAKLAAFAVRATTPR